MSIGTEGLLLGGLGAQANCGQLGSAFDMAQARSRAQGLADLRRRQNFIPMTVKSEPKTLREELQKETDEWIGDL